jgi:GGDEF domain-containing protein
MNIKFSNDLDVQLLKDGESCGHPGCLNHITHPCEQCGRIGGKENAIVINDKTKSMADYIIMKLEYYQLISDIKEFIPKCKKISESFEELLMDYNELANEYKRATGLIDEIDQRIKEVEELKKIMSDEDWEKYKDSYRNNVRPS